MLIHQLSLGGAFGEAYVARAPEGVGSGGGEPAGATTAPQSGTSDVGATPSGSSATSGVSSPPASAPTSPATSPGEPSGSDPDGGAGATETPAFDMFSNFFEESDLGLDGDTRVAPATPPKTGGTETPPGPGGAEPPKLPPTPPPPPLAAAAATTGPGVESSDPALERPSLPLHDPGALSDFIRQNSSVLEPQIAEQLFKLSPEDVKALEEDFVGSVPKLQARVFLQIQTAVLGQLAKMVPAMYEHMNARTEAGRSLETEFLEQFPGLKRADHSQLIRTTASALKQIDPKMSKADLFAKTGAIVMQLAGVVPGATSAQSPVSSPPAAPARTKMDPFTPAPSGAGAGRNSHGVVAVNEWQGLDPASQA